MSVEVLDEKTVADFVNDSKVFEKCVDEKFKTLDADGDGVLSREELQRRFGKLSSSEFELQSRDEIANLYDVLFDKFDVDRNGTIDPAEFRALVKEILLAKARGIGDSPVCFILQSDSLLLKAAQHADRTL